MADAPRSPALSPTAASAPVGKPAPAAAPHETLGTVRLHSLSCPRCAGVLRSREGERVIRCSHCATPYLAASPAGYERRYFPAKVQRLQAVGRAAVWLSEIKDVPNDVRKAVFTEAHLLYAPVWECRAYVVGWEFGTKRRTKRELVQFGEQDVVQLQLVDETVEQGYLDERRMYQEAADLAALGMGRPHITGRDFTLPYLPGELEEGAAVLETDRDYTEVLERARDSFRRPPTGVAQRDARFFLLKESVTLVYYPLWSLHYRYRGRLYEVTVDGRNGVIHSARAPADNTRRLAVMLASYAALALALAVTATAWQAWEGMREPAIWAAVLIAVLAGTVYWRFSLLREVEHHEPFSA